MIVMLSNLVRGYKIVDQKLVLKTNTDLRNLKSFATFRLRVTNGYKSKIRILTEESNTAMN